MGLRIIDETRRDEESVSASWRTNKFAPVISLLHCKKEDGPSKLFSEHN